MLRVEIVLRPFGMDRESKVLGTLEIGNDGTGTPRYGNYNARLFGKAGRLMAMCEIKDWPRQRKHAWDLVTVALMRLRPEAAD